MTADNHGTGTGEPSHGERMQAVQTFFKRDRFAHHSAIELVEVAAGFARARMTLQPLHLNGLDIAHGGAIFTLADFAFAAASNSHGTVAVAINATISIVKAVSQGTLWAEAREVSRSRKVGTYAVEVKNEAGDLIALFQGTVYRKSEALPL
jgi:acyl-CoA thioesterase